MWLSSLTYSEFLYKSLFHKVVFKLNFMLSNPICFQWVEFQVVKSLWQQYIISNLMSYHNFINFLKSHNIWNGDFSLVSLLRILGIGWNKVILHHCIIRFLTKVIWPLYSSRSKYFVEMKTYIEIFDIHTYVLEKYKTWLL